MGLSDRELAVLDFERRWWTLPGPKEADIRRCLSLSPTTYYGVLAGLVDSDDALRHDPLLVRRLRRLRTSRRRARYQRTPTGRPSSR